MHIRTQRINFQDLTLETPDGEAVMSFASQDLYLDAEAWAGATFAYANIKDDDGITRETPSPQLVHTVAARREAIPFEDVEIAFDRWMRSDADEQDKDAMQRYMERTDFSKIRGE